MGFQPYGIVATDEPAVQAEVSITLARDTEITVIKVPFTADSNVASRDIEVEISIGSDVIFTGYTPASIDADETKYIYMIAGTDAHVTGDYEYEPLPLNFKVPRGTTITTTTTNFQAGDQFGKVIVFGNTSG